MGKWNELPETDLRCCGFDEGDSVEDTDDADAEVFEAVDAVRCKEDASDETEEFLAAVSGRVTLYRLGRLYRSSPEAATNILTAQY